MHISNAKNNFNWRYTSIVITLLLLFSNQNIFPQQTEYKFDKLKTSEENFPKMIYTVIKDKRGFVWFGTDLGLYRFDGYYFKNYSHESNDPNSISSNRVMSICEDDNCLWIGTFNGLNRFDKTTEDFKVYKLNPDDKSSPVHNNVLEVFLSRNEELWIGTQIGLHKFDKTTGKFTLYNNPEDTQKIHPNIIVSLCEDKDSNLWIGTWGGGLYNLESSNKLFKNYKFSSMDSNSLSSNFVRHILEDNNGDIWVATHNGVNKFDKSKEKFYLFYQDSLNSSSSIRDYIHSMTKDKDGMLWFGYPEGISIFDPVKNIFTNIERKDHPTLPSEVGVIYTDKMGIVWICKFEEGGFVIYNKDKWKFNHYNNFLNNSHNISRFDLRLTFGEDINENTWIGSAWGIDVINKNKQKIRHFENNPNDTTSLGNNNISYIYRDKKNYMWIGTRGGSLDKYEPETQRFTHFYDFDGKGFTTSGIIEDKEENLWVGLSNGGIRVFDKNRNLKKKYFYAENSSENFSNLRIYKIYQDSKGYIYIGTDQGLAMLEPKTDSIIFYRINANDTNTINSNRVFSISEDKTGFLWVVTADEGLNRFETHTKIFKHVSIDREFNLKRPYGIQQDNNGNLWIQDIMSLTMFNPDNELSINYSLKEGIQGRFFYNNSSFKSKDGEMFFGGTKGFTSFYPDSIRINKNIPAIVLTDFRIFNKEVKLDTSITEKKMITISYKENFFSFDFASLDYTSPEKNQHAYILEGIDKDWNNVGNVRTANYTDIEPGEYTFKVKGSNNDGVWNEEGTSINIIITPPWWQTWWFKSCGAVLILMTFGFGFKSRLNKLKKEKQAQEDYSRKLLASQEEERKRIANELHDSIAHDILILKNNAEIAMKNTKEEETKSALNEISEQSLLTLNDVRTISYNLHPQQIESLGLTKAIKSMIDKVSKSTKVNFIADLDNIDKIFPEVNEVYIYRIIQEAINNIIKHSDSSEAIIKISANNGSVSILISDNGKGFDLSKHLTKNSLGLSGISERVKMLGGTISINSGKAEGTLLKISIPVSLKVKS